MSTKRVVALVVGCVLIIPALGMLIGGGALAIAYATQRDDGGYFDVTVDPLESPTVAVTGEDVKFSAEPGSPDWLIDAIDLDIRLRATSLDPDRPIFVGIARQADVDAYLDGVAHDRVVSFDDESPDYRRTPGTDEVGAPVDQLFWVESATGTGQQELVWEATGGRWAAVLMNADGSAGVEATVTIGARSDIVLPLMLVLIGFGLVLTTAAVVLIVVGASGARREPPAGGAAADVAAPTGAAETGAAPTGAAPTGAAPPEPGSPLPPPAMG
jgi:hypothetical protein